MDLAERIARALTALAVAGVIVLAAVGPVKSEIDVDTLRHLSAIHNPGGVEIRVVLPPAEQLHARPPERSRTPPALEPDPSPPPDERHAGDPGAGGRSPGPRAESSESRSPYEPGTMVPYVAQTIYVPEEAREKYRHFEDIYDLSMTADGQPTPDGEGWLLGEIAADSPLKTVLGFRRGDIIISVNDRPARADSARQLYEELKNERSFRVLIDRGGTRIEVPYTVK